MHRQATAGPVDAITGDYLAEIVRHMSFKCLKSDRVSKLMQNLANNAQAVAKNEHPGYEPTALDGLLLSLEAINEKRIKVVINGGALNPKGLAEVVFDEVRFQPICIYTR